MSTSAVQVKKQPGLGSVFQETGSDKEPVDSKLRLVASKRELENPAVRLPIPADFPKMMGSYAVHRDILSVITAELSKHGVSLKSVKRINIAYPHKHPVKKKDHHNNAEETVRDVCTRMREIAPGISWVPADAIYETVHLDRSGDQSSKHALLKRQSYAVDPALQKEPFPFIDSDNTDQEYFIVIDHMAEQGTTLANLISYITHNGGKVLAAVASSHHLAQQNSQVSIEFTDPAKNTGRIPDIAKAFSDSAKKDGLDYTPEQCMDLVEENLKACGNSLFALTEEECRRLIYSLNGGYGHKWSFKEALESFGVDLKQQEADAADPGDLKSAFEEQPVSLSKYEAFLPQSIPLPQREPFVPGYYQHT